MSRKLALGFLALAPPVVLLTFFVGGDVGEAVFALLAVLFPVALIGLGAGREGRLGPLAVPLMLFALWMAGGVVGMLLFRGRVLDGPWLWGLPLAGAIQFYGVFLVPFFLVSLAYGLTFDRFGLRTGDLEKLRARFKKPGSEKP